MILHAYPGRPDSSAAGVRRHRGRHLGVLSMISNRNSRAAGSAGAHEPAASLAEIEDPAEAKKEQVPGLIDTAKALSAPLMPQTELEQNDLKIKLANAGFRSDAAPMVYSGICAWCRWRVLRAGRWRHLRAGPDDWTAKTLQGVFILTGVGFYLPSDRSCGICARSGRKRSS